MEVLAVSMLPHVCDSIHVIHQDIRHASCVASYLHTLLRHRALTACGAAAAGHAVAVARRLSTGGRACVPHPGQQRWCMMLLALQQVTSPVWRLVEVATSGAASPREPLTLKLSTRAKLDSVRLKWAHPADVVRRDLPLRHALGWWAQRGVNPPRRSPRVRPRRRWWTSPSPAGALRSSPPEGRRVTSL